MLQSNLPGVPGEMNRHGPGSAGGIPKSRIPQSLRRERYKNTEEVMLNRESHYSIRRQAKLSED